jgi:hypothetical protein
VKPLVTSTARLAQTCGNLPGAVVAGSRLVSRRCDRDAKLRSINVAVLSLVVQSPAGGAV